MTDILTKDQQIKQLEIAVEELDLDRNKLEVVLEALEIIRHNLAEWRRDLLKVDEETTEEIVAKEAIAILREILGNDE